jgi:hypothetical protein
VEWTREGEQPLVVVALLTGGRGMPIYWWASQATVLKGRRRRSERAVIRRAGTRVQGALGQRRVLLTADRGFAAVAVVDVLTELGVPFILRVKGSTKVAWQGPAARAGHRALCPQRPPAQSRPRRLLPESPASVVGDPESGPQPQGRVGDLVLD